ncbi:sigma-54-dependent Fis family transcriptional regulator [bacterium]|nr:sigma-54-dependent Fis family transcriptional regulator [bacterium]
MLVRAVIWVDDVKLRRDLRQALAQPNIIVRTLSGRDRFWERAARETCDLLVISRATLPEPASSTVRQLCSLPESPEVVVLMDEEDSSVRASLLAAGCKAVLHSRLALDQLVALLAAVVEERREEADRQFAVGRDVARPRLTDFVSSSATMRAFMMMASRVVHTDTALLLLGETGVGKERLARAIHAEGPRAQGPFVTVNCGALPEALLESELFGHEEGAFTGATRTRRGRFEVAHGGTIFLDEIGDLPFHLQVKLLRALQEHEVQPVGSEAPIQVDVRVMAATNRDLHAAVADGEFRRDLYYRLSVVTLTIPPLRERVEDIPELVESYLDYFRPRVGVDVEGITDEALDALCHYDWPGNVRELINVIERATLLCCGDEIGVEDLPESIGSPASRQPAGLLLGPNGSSIEELPEEWLERPLADVRADVVAGLERAYLTGLLRATSGSVGETARRAGIQPRSLYDKMKQHGLRKEDFKPRRAAP